jgi:hypothetical protein
MVSHYSSLYASSIEKLSQESYLTQLPLTTAAASSSSSSLLSEHEKGKKSSKVFTTYPNQTTPSPRIFQQVSSHFNY